MRPTPFRLLVALMNQPQSLRTKEQLLEEVWPGVVVTDDVLTTAMKELRQAIGDNARAPTYIETVHRRGYRFMVAVEQDAGGPVPESVSRTAPHRMGFAIAGLLVTAVLGYVLMYSSPDQPVDTQPPAFAALDIQSSIPGLDDKFLGLLSGQFSRRGITPLSVAGAEFVIKVQLLTDEQPQRLKISFHSSDAENSNDVLYPMLHSLTKNSEADSYRIALLASQVLKCAGSLRSVSDNRFAGSPAVTAQLFELCTQPGLSHDRRASAIIAEQLWRNLEDNASALAIYSAVLSATESQYLFGQQDSETMKLHQRAEEFAEQASALQPDNPLSRAAVALVRGPNDSIWEEEQKLLQAPTDTWLGAFATIRRAHLMRATGRLAEASRLYNAVLVEWPAMLNVYPPLSLAEAARGRYQLAFDSLSAARELGPDIGLLRGTEQDLLLFYGPTETSRAILKRAGSRIPTPLANCVRFFLNARDTGNFEPQLLNDSGCESFDITRQARIRAALGDLAGALAKLETLDPAATGIAVVFYYPEFAPLTREQGYWNLLRSFGLVDYWRESQTLPDFCRSEELIDFCREQLALQPGSAID